jgi:23S rRNA (uracil1939-C5)-methyltransferase
MERFKVKVDEVTFGGRGVGRVDGKVCFIPATAPGDLVLARLSKDKNDYIEAYPLEIIEPGPGRQEPACPMAARPCSRLSRGRIPDYCPGCAYQHLEYALELDIKQQQLISFVERLPDFDAVEVLPPFGSPKQLGYRNKITLHASVGDGSTRLGYVGRNNQTVLDIPDCPLAMPELRELLRAEREKKGFFHSLKDEMHVTLRRDSRQTMLWRGNPPKNASWLREEYPFGTLSIPCGSFSQVNPGVASELVNRVTGLVKASGAENVIDLYCGAGLFACAAAKAGAKRVRAVDSDGPAIAAAEYNLKNCDHPDAEAVVGNAGFLLNDLAEGMNPAETMLIIDPPRTGLDRRTRDKLCNLGFAHVVYVSCSPDTLCRDLSSLIQHGYNLKSVGLLDMFPRTSHFESICYLEKS